MDAGWKTPPLPFSHPRVWKTSLQNPCNPFSSGKAPDSCAVQPCSFPFIHALYPFSISQQKHTHLWHGLQKTNDIYVVHQFCFPSFSFMGMLSLLNTEWCLPQGSGAASGLHSMALLDGSPSPIALCAETGSWQCAGCPLIPGHPACCLLKQSPPGTACPASLGCLTSLLLIWCWRQHYVNYLLLMMSPK